MPYIKVYIHFLWTTKYRTPFLHSPDLRVKVWTHIKENAALNKIYVDTVNGHTEHCHCLVSMHHNHTMSKVMQLMKGESSNWINKHNLCEQRFEWQEEYFATSVSESAVGKVRRYIQNQEEHHRKKPFQQEYDDLIEQFGPQFPGT